VHYTGKLLDGSTFDSSYDRKPFQFTVGTSQVIPGWEKAVKSMKVGQTAFIMIPPELAYGKEGLGDMIPPNSTLVFKI
jgi:FKBP-type peptidyl-prolyl cis-trans isomerase